MGKTKVKKREGQSLCRDCSEAKTCKVEIYQGGIIERCMFFKKAKKEKTKSS